MKHIELQILEQSYKELLKIDNVRTRLKLQDVYCTLRHLISERTGIDERIVQEAHEELATKEKYGIR